MLTKQEKIQRLQDCIALLHDVDAMQQTALGDSDIAYTNHNKLQELIDDFTDDVEALSNPNC